MIVPVRSQILTDVVTTMTLWKT